MLSSENKRTLLWATLLVAAFAVGFGLGIALWEGGSAPQGLVLLGPGSKAYS